MSPSIQPVGASSKINMLIHGDIGVGKTSLIGSGGKDFKTLIIHPPIDHMDPIIGSGAMEAIVRNWEDIFEVFEQLRHEGDQWDWVWLDSISLFQDIGLDDVYEGMLDQKGPAGSEARKNREAFGPDRGEYRVNMWRLAQWVRHIVGEGAFNLGIMGHSFWYEPEDGDAYLAPWIQGKGMVSKICGMMNIVGYMHLEEVAGRGGTTRERRVIEWNKTERYYAKNQFKKKDGTSVFPEGRSVNPMMPELVAAILSGNRPASAGRRRTPRAAAKTAPVRRTRRR